MIKLFFFSAVLCTVTVNAQDKLEISKGTTIASNDAVIVVEDMNLVNEAGSGALTGVTMKLVGSRNTFIGGKNYLFDHLLLDKQDGAIVSLDANLDITGSLQFNSGRLDLRHHIINLGNSGRLLNENESSHAFATGTGYIEAHQWLDHPVSSNPGNLGVYISSAASPGNTVVRRGHLSQLSPASGSSSLLRYFDIIPTNNQSLNASVRFSYFDEELDKLNESEIVMIKDELNTWRPLGFDSRSVTENFLEKKYIDNFSRITLSNTLSRLTLSTPAPAVKESFLLWPNPVLNTMNLSAHSMTAGNMRIKVYNSDGALVQVQDERLAAGINQLKLDMHKLPQGNYTIQTNWDGKVKLSKFSKM